MTGEDLRGGPQGLPAESPETDPPSPMSTEPEVELVDVESDPCFFDVGLQEQAAPSGSWSHLIPGVSRQVEQIEHYVEAIAIGIHFDYIDLVDANAD